MVCQNPNFQECDVLLNQSSKLKPIRSFSLYSGFPSPIEKFLDFPNPSYPRPCPYSLRNIISNNSKFLAKEEELRKRTGHFNQVLERLVFLSLKFDHKNFQIRFLKLVDIQQDLKIINKSTLENNLPSSSLYFHIV